MSQIVCPQCGARLSPTDQTCMGCGYDVQAARVAWQRTREEAEQQRLAAITTAAKNARSVDRQPPGRNSKSERVRWIGRVLSGVCYVAGAANIMGAIALLVSALVGEGALASLASEQGEPAPAGMIVALFLPGILACGSLSLLCLAAGFAISTWHDAIAEAFDDMAYVAWGTLLRREEG